MAEWTANLEDLGWLLDEYKDNVERRLLAVQREERTRARLDHIAELCRDLSREKATDTTPPLVPETS